LDARSPIVNVAEAALRSSGAYNSAIAADALTR
jgi:hypothetical protein